MDIVIAKAGVEVGFLKDYDIDYEMSTEKGDNTFQIKLQDNLDVGDSIYCEGTEIGGIIRAKTIDTAKGIKLYDGKTWRGMLENKILEPPSGADYYIVSGDLNDVIHSMIIKTAYEDIFEASDEPAGVSVTNYKFKRYVDMYSGLIRLLSEHDMKLNIEMHDGKVILSAVPITDYSQEAELTSDEFDFTLKREIPKVNHMIGLGSGELAERMVVHRYLDANGVVSDIQHYFGADERTDVYDYSSVESEEELIKGTEEKLAEYAVKDSLKVVSYNLDADLGDKYLAEDKESGISVEQYVTTKIYTITDDMTKINYKVGGRLS